MQAILRRLPTSEQIERNKAKLAGFAAGIVVPIVAVLFFDAVRTGEGLYQPPSEPVVIYPNL
ncbi:hypothetical protein [Ovoidimarina sediminis]|uniref:hypothetical protein n=1 Tax=Ovoidimarina sediminis TaxID=3079856 RepID=UPI0029149E7B|nr:hypothetical protein [Rhodophyticola sp. MJ-SS7]MDU8943216.1 hypothetical protein [Rhodophyticola sp. MJ-SS7]